MRTPNIQYVRIFEISINENMLGLSGMKKVRKNK